MFANKVEMIPELDMCELMQALRIAMASEMEAAYIYEKYARATDDELVQRQLFAIRDEELRHSGELLALMRYLDENEEVQFLAGQQEVDDIAAELGFQTKTLAVD
jgi:rubrerythrin